MLFPEMGTWLRLLLTLSVAGIVSLLCTPIVKKLAERVGAIDMPEARRINDHPVPRMGGLAIFFGFMVSILLFADISSPVRGILVGAIVIVIVGVADDILSLKWWIKLLGQLAAALIAIAHGVTIGVLSDIGFMSQEGWISLGILSIPITIIWIVGVTNSLNLIDGLDGLACGVSAMSCFSLLVVSMIVAEPSSALILAALSGACIGFIPYNFNPAKIFMGDTGALLLGYVLSTVSVLGLFKFNALVTIVVPLLALVLPIFDTFFAIVRRIAHGQNPMKPDRGHLHHRLIDLGLSQKQSVFVLYALSAVFGMTAIVMSLSGTAKFILLAVEFIVVVFAWFYISHTIEHPANEKDKNK